MIYGQAFLVGLIAVAVSALWWLVSGEFGIHPIRIFLISMGGACIALSMFGRARDGL